ncbi:protein jag [Granulicoccus sp. GXG6511]|uniref:Jag family protein n=1 Tax=Granulicoccus sp. GXG6511 TaxID=3381351 RepID=UPI003D7CC8F3
MESDEVDADDDADAEDDSDDDDSDDDDADDDDSSDESDDDADDDESEDDTAERSGRSAKLVALDEEGDIAADYLEELLDIADLDGDIDTYTEGGRAHVSIVTDANVLVGKEGEVLEALQDLCRLAVMTETGKRSRLMLDIAGHREKRRRELTDLASDAVEEAKASGEAVRLTPMNPFERKIVHDVVAAAGLTSESDGEEPNRRVVVMPA